MIHPLANAGTLAILAGLFMSATILVAGYWPRIMAALRGRGGHV